MKKAVIAVFALLMVASIGLADGHGGGPGGGMGPGMGMGPDHGPGFEGGALVGSDGTIYITSATTTSGTTTVSVKAIRSTGATAWTATLPAGARGLTLSDGNLLTTSETRASDGTVTTTITAISTTSGSTAWTKTINGFVRDFVPFNGGTYAFVVTPATSSGGSAARSLVAIGNDGSVLWTVTL